ncbi:hypothetical protein BH09ACT8_BH09ACT8_32240 [soil metagenome]
MPHSIQVRGNRAATAILRSKATALRLALAGLFALILLGAAQESAATVPTILGFATAITILAAAFVGWERQVADAESAGLVATQQA